MLIDFILNAFSQTQADCRNDSERMFNTMNIDGNFKEQEIWLSVVLCIIMAVLFIVTVITVSLKWRDSMFLLLTPWFIIVPAAVSVKNLTQYRSSSSLIYYFEAWPLTVVHWVFAMQYLQTSYIFPVLLADAQEDLVFETQETEMTVSGRSVKLY